MNTSKKAVRCSYRCLTRSFPGPPRWVQEGLAGYMETLRFDRRNKGEIVRGETRWQRRDFIDHFPVRRWFGEVISVGDTFWEKSTFDGFAFETGATFLVHWMIDTRPRNFDAFIARLARLLERAAPLDGRGENAWVAFSAEFPDLREQELQAAMREYLKHPRAMAVTRFPMPSWKGDIQTHSVSRAEILATRAELFRYGPNPTTAAERDRLAEAEVSRALAEDPGNPLALRLSRHADPSAATRAHPEDYRSWVLAFDEHHDSAAIEKAAQLAPDDPGVLARFAIALQSQGKREEALHSAERAIEVGQSRSDVLDSAAQVLAANGRCDEALATEQRAIEGLPDSASREMPAYFRRRMNDLTNKCEEEQQQRTVERTVYIEPVLRSCKQPPPRLRNQGDSMEARLTIGEDGSVSGVSVTGAAAKPLQAAAKRFVESCSFEPVVVDGKLRSIQTTMRVPKR
jgi:tetratricopeptide (TPR) repeat protein